MSPKTPIIYLVRHAESAHNVSKNFNLRDPGLTDLGHAQASSLATSFPALDSVAVILASPLRRTIETTLDGFGNVLNLNITGKDNRTPDGSGTKLILDPDLQERSALPCDTGSEMATLQAQFPDLDFRGLSEGWYIKEGPNAADDEAVSSRATRVRRRLRDLAAGLQSGVEGSGGRRDIVVVTHGVFMKFLAQDQTIDLPKAGWKAFQFAVITDEEEGISGKDGSEEDALISVEV